MFRGAALTTAVSTGDVKQSVLDRRVRKVLEFVHKASRLSVSKTEDGRDCPEDRALNRKLCASSIVLLKNEGGILPLSKQTKKVALIGSHMQDLSILGLGSTALEPYYTINPMDAIKEKLGPQVELIYEPGVYAHQSLPLLNDRVLKNTKMLFYNEPRAQTDRKSIIETSLRQTRFHLVDFEDPNLNFDLFYVSVEADMIPDVSGIWDFGLSCHGTADFYINEELVIDNSTTQKPGDSFWGLGTVEERGSKALVAGQVYKLRVEFGSAATTKLKIVGGLALGGGGANLGACSRVDVEDGIRKAVKAASDSEVAIICTGISVCIHSETMRLRYANVCILRASGKAKAMTVKPCLFRHTSTT